MKVLLVSFSILVASQVLAEENPKGALTSDNIDVSLEDASESDSFDGKPVRWFTDFGVAFRAGGGIHSRALNDRSYDTGHAIGPELLLNVMEIKKQHGILITAGFMGLGRTTSKGTAEISVSSEYSRFDASLGYEFRWKLLVAGARVGAAFTLVKVETSYGHPTWEIVEVNGENTIEYHPPTDPEVQTERGLSTGFLAGAGVGIALGKYMFDIPGLIELRAQSDYVLRGARNEWLVFGNLIFWPTKLFKRS